MLKSHSIKIYIFWTVLGYAEAFVGYMLMAKEEGAEVILRHFTWAELFIRVLIMIPLLPLLFGFIMSKLHRHVLYFHENVWRNAIRLAKLFLFLGLLNLIKYLV